MYSLMSWAGPAVGNNHKRSEMTNLLQLGQQTINSILLMHIIIQIKMTF